MTRKRIGYGKTGRVIEASAAKWGETGGDNEPTTLLLDLADRHPDVDWVIVGKNSGWAPPRDNIINPWQDWLPELKGTGGYDSQRRVDIYDQLTFPTFDELDGLLLWAGQHGTSNSPIPKVSDRSELTAPQVSFVGYSSFLLRGINRWRRTDPVTNEEVWLIADVRNYIKGRDLKWPRRHPILGQFDFQRQEWCERYGDPRLPEEFGWSDVEVHDGMWRATDSYKASGLELVGIPPAAQTEALWKDFEDRADFGIVINEARGYGMRPELTRLHAMQNYILPLNPSWIRGTWPEASQAKMNLESRIHPVPYHEIFELMAGTKSTFTTPSSGSGWATAKPWESFGAGTICFFHPLYDTQGHILPTLADLDEMQGLLPQELVELTRWLRVTSPVQLEKRVKAVASSKETYEWLRDAQYRYLQNEQSEQRAVKAIEKRLFA